MKNYFHLSNGVDIYFYYFCTIHCAPHQHQPCFVKCVRSLVWMGIPVLISSKCFLHFRIFIYFFVQFLSSLCRPNGLCHRIKTITVNVFSTVPTLVGVSFIKVAVCRRIYVHIPSSFFSLVFRWSTSIWYCTEHFVFQLKESIKYVKKNERTYKKKTICVKYKRECKRCFHIYYVQLYTLYLLWKYCWAFLCCT